MPNRYLTRASSQSRIHTFSLQASSAFNYPNEDSEGFLLINKDLLNICLSEDLSKCNNMEYS